MNQDTNFSLVERVRDNGPAIGQDELLDLLAELDAWRAIAGSTQHGIYGDSPEEILAGIIELENRQMCIDEDHANYGDLKEFFDDCVQALEDESGRWPCAKAYDLNLRQVICEAIRNGVECEE